MTLIERGLRQDMGAEVQVNFAPSGVTATLIAPLTRDSRDISLDKTAPSS